MSKSHESVVELFGSNVFNDLVMRERLPKNVYKSFKQAIEGYQSLDPALGDVIANAMKDWAIEKGATHFCHWFQPMTGLTAEKHNSFISPTAEGSTIMEFSGRELVKGEPDASSFPSGGLRATFEARGYTAWDCTSPVFVKEDGENITLYIPSAFCSYTGHALDKKTPLLRSMEALNRQAMRVLGALGDTTSRRVTAMLGPEQEYFLLDRSFVEKRLDLALTGRTLFGAATPKGQERGDHYFGPLHERVASFMHEVNIELWKLGVSAKTQHNEVAPAQYEIVPVFASVNVATDHNQLTMETLRKVALRHNFICLLDEKPFAGINGSGKHNNWSMITDEGINLFEPGNTPHDNMVFLVMLCSVVRAVDKYAKLLRASVANAGNEHRLGSSEAPPAIISIYLGDQLTDIFEQFAGGSAKSSKQSGELRLGVSALPRLAKDYTDRNRTSPLAFTGNKFEFRMVGSSQSTAGPAFVLNTIVADVLAEIADELEKADDVNASAQKIIQRIACEHRRVIFNGDNYGSKWVEEAKKRGLPNMPSAVEALNSIMDEENVQVFERQEVLSEAELCARTKVLLEDYSNTINTEINIMLNIAKRQIIPAASHYSYCLANTFQAISAAGQSADAQKQMLAEVCNLIESLRSAVKLLENTQDNANASKDVFKRASAYRDSAISVMQSLRTATDQLETIVDADIWPLPTYAEMLFFK